MNLPPPFSGTAARASNADAWRACMPPSPLQITSQA